MIDSYCPVSFLSRVFVDMVNSHSPLREEPRTHRAPVIPLKQELSLLDWLKQTGRLIARSEQEPDFTEDEEEISEFLGGDDGGGYDDDDDDVSLDE